MIRRFLIFLFLFISKISFVWAQCSMCRAVPTSNYNQGGTIANGLNNGIIYLLLIPYLVLMFLLFYFFHKPIIQWFKNILHKN